MESAEPTAQDVGGDNRGSSGAGLAAWIESRSGLGAILRAALNPLVPSTARWRYALGASLGAALVVEAVTGLLLMVSYSPSTTTAWGSTFYIDRVLTAGWFIRGMHGFGAHAMIVVAALHLLSVVAAGVYRAPREMNWWLGLAMLGMVIVFTLSGNALVWDQDGYWAWNVETSIAGGAPVVGPLVQRLIVGGAELGNGALGRLYALHVGLLPALVLVALGGHVALARRHALARPDGRTGSVEPAWPKQVFVNLLTSVVLLGIVAALVVVNHGVALEAPADPAGEYPARPAWFFLWLFELRKRFTGSNEVIATMVIPGAITGVLVLLPFLDRLFPRRFAHFVACGFVFAVLGGASYLTVRSLRADAADPHHRETLEKSAVARDRAVSLARLGVPPEGASALLTQDPLFHGRAVLDAKCLGCHVYGGQGVGTQTAPDLKDFGSRAWIRGLLDAPKSPTYFGKVAQSGGMARWKKNSKLTPKELDDVADFFAKYVVTTPPDLSPAEWLALDGLEEHPGYKAFNKDGECVACHTDWSGPSDEAPSLFGWGTPQWITRMTQKPGAPDKYGYLDAKDRMPSYAGQLTDNDVRTVVRYLKNDYPGAPVSPEPASDR